jgi:two-component system, NarL family, nitrate/nitrite response regulator NarL
MQIGADEQCAIQIRTVMKPTNEARVVPFNVEQPFWPGCEAAPARIRILIADNYPINRQGLRLLLDGEPDFRVVGEAANAPEAAKLTPELRPDVLLLNLPTSELSGWEGLSRLIGQSASVRAILMTPSIDTSDTVKVLRFGASGIVLKDSPAHLLFKSIRCVFGGELWLGREVISDVVRALSMVNDRPREAATSYRLTRRQREVLSAAVTGCTNKEIAQKLSITEDTVKHHMTSIFDKTGMSNRLELALFAIHHQFVPAP